MDPNIQPHFEPGQLINRGQLSEKLHDITLFSPQYEDGKTISEGNCIIIRNVSVPNVNNFNYNYNINYGNIQRREGQTVEGKIDRFLYYVNRNGDVKEVNGFKLTNGHEIVFEDGSYAHQSYSDFTYLEVIQCNNNMEMNGGKKKRNKRRHTKKRRHHKKKTLRRRKN